ncbi:MAG: thioredoxin domain-containing protein [Acidimicrobiales bacterium]
MSGEVWVASYVLLWITVIALGVIVVALLRQVGVLHARLRPVGVHHANEGPEPGSTAPPVPGLDFRAASLHLLVFTSPECVICRELKPSLTALDNQYRGLRLTTIDLADETNPVFTAFRVRSTPYVVTVDGDGLVRGRGVANTLEQVEVLLEEAMSDG